MSVNITDPFFPNDPFNPWPKYNSVYMSLLNIPGLSGGKVDNALLPLQSFISTVNFFNLEYSILLPDTSGVNHPLNVVYTELKTGNSNGWYIIYRNQTLYQNQVYNRRSIPEKLQIGNNPEQTNGWEGEEGGSDTGLSSLLLRGNRNDLTLMENRRLTLLGYK